MSKATSRFSLQYRTRDLQSFRTILIQDRNSAFGATAFCATVNRLSAAWARLGKETPTVLLTVLQSENHA